MKKNIWRRKEKQRGLLKCLAVLLMLGGLAPRCFASHIIGGEVYYEYKGRDGRTGNSLYKVSLRLFRDCNVPCGGGVACLPDKTLVSVYENGNDYKHIDQLSMPLEDDQTFSLNPRDDNDYPPCITSRPSVCYEVKIYSATIALPDNNIGYIIAYENCCRASTSNVENKNPYSASNQPGAVYDCTIPGTNQLATGHNSSAVFSLQKPDLLCYDSRFTLDYTAIDPDAGDSLSFVFAPALSSGAGFSSANDDKAAEYPPYPSVTYNTSKNFFSSNPLGSKAGINAITGEISGISPSPGLYVVSVFVYEYRNKVRIARHRKDFIVHVQDCNVPEARLDASYLNCNGYTVQFSNEATSANINSYYWDFGDTSNIADTSVKPEPSYTFPKAGTYQVKLVVNRGRECSDSVTTEAKVYPGLVPDFSVTGNCLTGTVFTDKSTTVYGQLVSWFWDFGDVFSVDDYDVNQNPPPYKYTKSGRMIARLFVQNDKGCIDSVTKTFTVYDAPLVQVPLADTLICNLDSIQLSASSNNASDRFVWTPTVGIANADTQTPTVHPQQTTLYYVNVTNERNCVTTDSVWVRVTDHVNLTMPADTLLCLTDTAFLRPVSDGLSFLWSPAETVSNFAAKSPFAIPAATTTYHLQANIGSCRADDEVTIHTSPYPVSEIDKVSPVCFGGFAYLHASYQGTEFNWSPASTLQNASTLTPTAGPSETTVYTLTVRDQSPNACPKTVSDSVTLVVIQPLPVNAGRDTSIVVGQDLQLAASGARFYEWQPATGMNQSNIADPVVRLPANITQIRYTVKGSVPEGCSATDSITVYQYKTLPEIFVPSAFTPDGDGVNDILKPITAGIKTFRFSIYNRLGQLMYTTSVAGEGWNGTYKGVRQPGGTFVYEATATDYLDKHLIRKGTVVLIR